MRTSLRFFRGALAALLTGSFLAVIGGAWGQIPGFEKPGTKDSFQAGLRRSARAFVENKGQWPADARYMVRQPGMNLWITLGGWKFDQYRLEGEGKNAKRAGQVVEFNFLGANKNAKVYGTDPTRLHIDYLHGRDHNVRGIRSYREVWAQSLYSGVDARWYFDGELPRYDLVIAPGANPQKIRLHVKGSEGLSLAGNGDLNVTTKYGGIVQANLNAYQIVAGKRAPVKVAFRIVDKNTVVFETAKYDRKSALVVDPLVYGSYYGGDSLSGSGWDEVRGIVADDDQGVYVTGWTQSADFPNIAGPYGFTINGAQDAFFSKFQGDAYNHDYAAYIGGSDVEMGQFVGIDPSGNHIWMCGTTSSPDLPGITGSSYQSAMAGFSDLFLYRFTKDAAEVVVPDYATYFGTTGFEELQGFAVSPVSGELAITGTTDGGLANMNNSYLGGASDAFLVRFNVNATGISGVKYGFYVGGTGEDVAAAVAGLKDNGFGSGVAFDRNDNVLVAGTIRFIGNVDTSIDPSPFMTTPGVFPEARLLRNWDGFVRKYDATGAIVFSALLGGNGIDECAGVTADPSGNVYMTGVARSFNFPRTRGVFGENFSDARVVYASKISPDGRNLLYSTHLRTSNWVDPRGIAVDTRGIAYIAGTVQFNLIFPFPPADPNLPNGVIFGNIPITADALDPDYSSPQPPVLPATEGFLLALTPTASNLLYGTYIGGFLDEQCYAPYVDALGDVWVNGSSEDYRIYVRFSRAGNPTIHETTAGTRHLLPNSLLSTFAFKRSGDGSAATPITKHYGLRESPFTGPSTITAFVAIDGFLIKQRLSLPTITSLTLAPSSVAGGLGATSVGTLTLSGPVPAGGLDVTVTLDNPAASFNPAGPQNSIVLTIAGGQNTAQFTMYTNPVLLPTQVNIRANLEGNFQIAVLTVQPWLQQLTITPPSIVGGNIATGRIRLWQPAITDITIDITTDTPALVSFPGGLQVTVPAGIDTVAFPIQTHGVNQATLVGISAGLLGVQRNQSLNLLTANLVNVIFNPVRIMAGASSTGTLQLDGEAGSSGFVVNLTLGPGTPGYTLNPVQLTFNSGDRTKSFAINTVYEPVSTQRTVTATRPLQGSYPAQSVSGVLFVDAAELLTFTVDRTSMNPGETANGTVSINVPASTGGATVDVTTDNPILTVTSPVIIGVGLTSSTFPIVAINQALENDTVVTVTATRGPVSIARQITVRKSTATLSIIPASVVGGATAQGTVSLASPAGAGGVTFALLSNNPGAAGVPASVTVTNGQTSANFQVTTFSVATLTQVTITATAGAVVASANIEVRPVGVFSLQFIPGRVRGGSTGNVTLRVILDAPAPPGGATVTLTYGGFPVLVSPPAAIAVSAGQTSRSVTLLTRRVSRTLQTIATGSLGGRQASASLVVTR